MLRKIQIGMQLGIEKRIDKDGVNYWYSYAIQKKGDIYYVYESEIAEDNMASEVYEYERVLEYSDINEIKKNFSGKYGIKFENLHVLKGQKIFNVNFFV